MNSQVFLRLIDIFENRFYTNCVMLQLFVFKIIELNILPLHSHVENLGRLYKDYPSSYQRVLQNHIVWIKIKPWNVICSHTFMV